VEEIGSWVEGQWVWDLRCIDLFVWDINLLKNLHEIMNRSTISADGDSRLWKHDSSGDYSVKLAFLTLSRSIVDEVVFFVAEEKVAPKSVEKLGLFKSGGLFLATST
jgi:hypothetical protein